jgi:hypothetical protein
MRLHAKIRQLTAIVGDFREKNDLLPHHLMGGEV